MDRQEISSPLRVLLIEDNEHDQIAFDRALMKSGIRFELTLCERAEDIAAVIQAGSNSFDLVVVDYNLPGLNGLEAYRRLRGKTDLPPFVMLTGTGSESLAVGALKAGMYDYIIKDPNQRYLQLLPLKLAEVKQRHDDRKAHLKAKADLKKAYAELEQMVKNRTVELARTVRALEREISERRQTEQALRDSQQTLRALSLKIVESQENERKLVAKELHDSIASSLAAIKFALEEKLEQMSKEPREDIASLEKIVGYLLDTIQEVRRISTSLRPSMLDDLGLLTTIRWYCRSTGEMYANTRIEVRLKLEESDIPELSKIVIYRVLQEALNNALKHSTADSVQVSLEKVNGCIQLCVNDNGCGFDPQSVTTNPDPLSGYGLRSMRDRAEVVGGSLSIDSRQGQGTAVCLKLPCELR